MQIITSAEAIALLGSDAIFLDVRSIPEFEAGHAPGAVNIPLPQLRSRLAELPRHREIQVICRSGGRAWFATRILLQNGFAARNVSGGMLSRLHAVSTRPDNHGSSLVLK